MAQLIDGKLISMQKFLSSVNNYASKMKELLVGIHHLLEK